MIDGAGSAYDLTIGTVFIADSSAPPEAAEAIDIAGGRIMVRAGWRDAAAAMGKPIGAKLLVAEASGASDAMLNEALPMLYHYAQAGGARIVISMDEGQINTVATHLFGRNVQWLCAPTMPERVAALTLANAMALAGHAEEIVRDAEAIRLRRLNEEVARIAETLARLTRDDNPSVEPLVHKVDDRRNGYGAPPAENGVSAHELRQAIRSRRMRAQFFEPSLLEDPAWDMLLDLYAADLERAQVSVSSLCIAAAVAPTTALRWIAKMTEAGLFERQPDPFDRRRAFMALSATARDGMRSYFAAIRRAGLSIA